MKILVFALLFVSKPCLAQEFLNEAQKDKVLREIDGTCADTWCEGDFRYIFKAVDCDSKNKECAVLLNMRLTRNFFKQVKKTETFTAKLQNSRDGICVVQNISSYEEILNSTQFELSTKFYEALNDCITVLESKSRLRK